MKRSEMLNFINKFYADNHDGEYYPSFCEELLNQIENKGIVPNDFRFVNNLTSNISIRHFYYRWDAEEDKGE